MTFKSNPTKPLPKKTITIPQAVVIACLSASISVLATALVCAHVWLGWTNVTERCSTTTLLHSTMTSSHHKIAHLQEGGVGGGLINSAPLSMQVRETKALSTTQENIHGPWPKVVWLMSFPNSGTSYTLHLVRTSTNTTTATNYALEGDIKDAPDIPIHGDAHNGPFLQICNGIHTNPPPRYIITKTHCSAFCSDCLPKNYIETPRSFEVSCRSGTKGMAASNGYVYKQPVTYDQGLVGKAVHIFRHPLDNIVARFHLEYNTLRKKTNGWEASHPNNSTGFMAWCKDMDRKSQLHRVRWIDSKLMILLSQIPCHEEFYRYVQWHNLAFDVTRGNGIPVHVIHYRNYSDNFEETLRQLLDFLELPRNGDIEPFHAGKVYTNYYTKEQRLNIRQLIQEFSSEDTWQNVKDYEF